MILARATPQRIRDALARYFTLRMLRLAPSTLFIFSPLIIMVKLLQQERPILLDPRNSLFSRKGHRSSWRVKRDSHPFHWSDLPETGTHIAMMDNDDSTFIEERGEPETPVEYTEYTFPESHRTTCDEDDYHDWIS